MRLKTFVAFLLFLLGFMHCFSVSAHAVIADGVMDERVWVETQPQTLISAGDVSNCGVSFGTVSLITEENTNRIHLGFKVKLSEPIGENADYGVAVRINSGEFIYVTMSGVSAYDTDRFSVESAIVPYSQTAFCAEISLGVKYGVSTVKSIDVRCVDASGDPSNIYAVDFNQVQPTTAQTVSSTAAVTTEKQVESTANLSATERTTKAKATKKTTKKTTTAKSGKTEKPELNVEANISSTFVNNETDMYINAVAETELTTVLTAKQMKLQQGFSYAAVIAIILLALGICLVVNISRDKNKSKDGKTD